MRSDHNYSVNKTLSKDTRYKKLSGVCAGIAKHYELPRLVVRAATVCALLMFPVATGVAYMVATLLMPTK
jgi:phage shock protein C